MPIDNVPAVQALLEQQNLLERAFQTPLLPRLAYAMLAEEEMFPNGIGETLTKTRPALYPLAAAMTPLSPAANTQNDNGLSDTYYAYEQYKIGIDEYALSTTVNIMQDFTLIQRVFLQNYVQLGENAGRTIDGLCALQVHQNYEAGNTYARVAASNPFTSLSVDNGIGFDTVMVNGVPTAVSSGNPVTATVYSVADGSVKGTLNITACAFDGSNLTTSKCGGVNYGKSAVLTCSSAAFAVAIGDSIVANDGAVIIRPNNKWSRAALASTDVLDLITLARATAKLRARNVPTLPGSDRYAAIIDPTLWPQLLSDQAFQRATMGHMGSGYFANAMVSETLGLEFVNSSLVPNFPAVLAGQTNVAAVRHVVVGGMGLLVKGTFQGSIDAARFSNTLNNADIRLIHDAKISLITRGPLDRLQEFVTQTWRWVGGFVTPTDALSTPLIVPTTDNARYKRCVIIEVASTT